MNHLAIDIETYSSADLRKGGVYKYVASPDFEILLFAYSINGGPVQVVDMTEGRGLPADIMKYLTAENFLKTAWNAAFEICCINKFFKIEMPKHQWECTMVKASMLSLPMALGQASYAMQLGVQKDKGGAALIKYFCVPCKPTKVNKGRLRNLPEHDPAKWMEFNRYVKRDVETERAVGDAISWFTIPETEQKLWELDQEINDRGVLMDQKLILQVMQVDNDFRVRTIKEAVKITGLSNPNSVSQLLTWLKSEMDIEEVQTLRKEAIPILKDMAWEYVNYENINRVLEIRQELAKTSIKKYQAMVNVRGDDGRARGLFQFYGANRTGRWAGRLLQFHNLPKTTMDEFREGQLDRARRGAMKGNLEVFDLLDFQDEDGMTMTTPAVLSQLIRTAFIPKPGCKFVVVDSSAIEARIIAWLSGEKWRLEVFATHGKIYEASAAKMFDVPFEKVSKDDRARGKVAELALGYQGGPNAMMRMDTKKKVLALAVKKWNADGKLRQEFRFSWDAKCTKEKKKFLTDEELLEEFIFLEYKSIVDAWRPANPAIKEMWADLNQAALEVVDGGGLRRVGFVELSMKKGSLFIKLPSGRHLVYLRPVIRTKIIKPKKGDPFEVTGVAYLGVDQATGTWGYEHTYGGKLTENICQAIARDCLGYWIAKAANSGLDIVAHVHDEIVIEEPESGKPEQVLKDVIKMMSKEIPWAPGLPLAADGFITDYYKKD